MQRGEREKLGHLNRQEIAALAFVTPVRIEKTQRRSLAVNI